MRYCFTRQEHLDWRWDSCCWSWRSVWTNWEISRRRNKQCRKCTGHPNFCASPPLWPILSLLLPRSLWLSPNLKTAVLQIVHLSFYTHLPFSDLQRFSPCQKWLRPEIKKKWKLGTVAVLTSSPYKRNLVESQKKAVELITRHNVNRRKESSQ